MESSLTPAALIININTTCYEDCQKWEDFCGSNGTAAKLRELTFLLD